MPETAGEGDDRLEELETQSASAGAGGLPAASVLVPGLTVLCHPDLDRVGERAALTSLAAGLPASLARGQPLFSPPGKPLRRPLADLHLSRSPMELTPGDAAGAVRIRRLSSQTALAVGGQAVTGEREVSAAEMAQGVVLLLAHRIVLLLSLVDPLTEDLPRYGLLGDSWRMALVRRKIRQLVPLDHPVLLRGETGTGKELVARALHRSGPRRGGPFVAVNMGAIPPALAAAELFGAARGAFTGADRARQGYFGRADGGTLFLDEIGESPLEIQVLLLRALENREIQPVGSGEIHAVDVRLISATDAALEQAVSSGRFQAPLLHRLGGYEIRLPPLRERREDFGRLFFHFLAQELQAVGAAERLAEPPSGARPWTPAALVAWLAQRHWPGNVRQLQNVARQLAVDGHRAPEAALDPAVELDLAADNDAAWARPVEGTHGVAPALPERPRPARRAFRPVTEITDEELRAALQANGWRIKPAASQLGVARASLYARLGSGSRFRKSVELTRDEIEQCRARCGGDLERMAEVLEVSPPGLRQQMNRLGLGRP